MVKAIPSNADELTLGQWIGFYEEYGRALDQKANEANAVVNPVLKQFAVVGANMDRLFSLTAYFKGITVEEAEKSYTVNYMAQLQQEKYSKYFDVYPIDLVTEYEWRDETWVLPTVDLLPESQMKFGEFLDSKIVLQNAKHQELSKWQLLHQIAAIFFRKKGEVYKQEFLFAGSDRLKHMEQLPMRLVLTVGDWFEKFNNSLMENYNVFHKSSVKSGRYMMRHFEQWGWINFLASIAKTKVFDIPNSGLNSIECAKLAPLVDVLIYAGQEKSFNEASYADMEAQKSK